LKNIIEIWIIFQFQGATQSKNTLFYFTIFRFEQSEREIKFSKEAYNQITTLFEEFKNEITELINNLELIGKGNLKFLAMKLDYNYYYSEREIENIHKKQQQRFDNYDEDDEEADDLDGNYEDEQVENENSQSRGMIRINMSRSNNYQSEGDAEENLNNNEHQYSQGEEELDTKNQNQIIVNQTSNMNYNMNNLLDQSQGQGLSQSQIRYNFINQSQNNLSEQEETKKSFQDMISDSSRRFDMRDFINESQNNNQTQGGNSQDHDQNEDGQ
jgi:hypothetical protein